MIYTADVKQKVLFHAMIVDEDYGESCCLFNPLNSEHFWHANNMMELGLDLLEFIWLIDALVLFD